MKIKFAKMTVFVGIVVFALSAQWVRGEEFHFQNVPLNFAIRSLAQQTGHNFILSPNLTDNQDAGGKRLSNPTVNFQGDVAPAELLAKLLKENGLVMVDDPATTVARITFTNESTIKADASLLAGDTNAPIPLLRFQSVPLGVAIENIARSGALKVVVDSKITNPQMTAGHQFVFPPQVSVKWEKITARQALLALAINYDLTITPDQQTGACRFEKR